MSKKFLLLFLLPFQLFSCPECMKIALETNIQKTMNNYQLYQNKDVVNNAYLQGLLDAYREAISIIEINDFIHD